MGIAVAGQRGPSRNWGGALVDISYIVVISDSYPQSHFYSVCNCLIPCVFRNWMRLILELCRHLRLVLLCHHEVSLGGSWEVVVEGTCAPSVSQRD